MSTSQRSFKLAVASKVGDFDEEYEPIDYTFEESDGKVRVITVHYPGDGAMALMISTAGADAGDEERATAIFSALEAAMEPDDYTFIRRQVRRNALPIEMVGQFVEDMVETWTAFPTQPPSDSPRTQPATGGRSTGRVRGQGSASSTSPRAAG